MLILGIVGLALLLGLNGLVAWKTYAIYSMEPKNKAVNESSKTLNNSRFMKVILPIVLAVLIINTAGYFRLLITLVNE